MNSNKQITLPGVKNKNIWQIKFSLWEIILLSFEIVILVGFNIYIYVANGNDWLNILISTFSIIATVSGVLGNFIAT